MCVMQLSFDFQARSTKEPSNFHDFLVAAKLYAIEIVTAVVTFLLIVDFALKEILPIIKSIGTLLRAP
jgi:hypothetical protein